MCLILERQPNTPLDKEAFFTAIFNNPDGYGLVVPEGDGQCVVIKELDFKDDDLWALINEEFYEDTIMVHLRYTTAGETSYRNLHPFPILEYRTDGVDLWMAHNGTLSDWRPGAKDRNAWESDTRNFVRNFVRPLFKRLIKGMEIEDILTDPFVYSLLDGQLSVFSVLSFIDGFGNTLQVNPTGNGGGYEKGLWFSNDYSFDPLHRTPKYSAKGSAYRGTSYPDYSNDTGWWHDPTKDIDNNTGTTVMAPTKASGKHAEDTMQASYTTKRHLDPDAIFGISDETMNDLTQHAPEVLEEICKEALFRAWQAEQELIIVREKKDKAEKMIAELKKEGTNAVAS